MARYFFDSSALIKYYHNEIGSPTVERILRDVHSEHLIARLSWVEILSGLAKKVTIATISPSDYGHLERRFRADVSQRLLRPVRMLNALFTSAGHLIGSHGLTRQLRALDAIRLAVALRVHRTIAIDHFVCADQRLCDVAVLEVLAIINPELTP